MGYLSSIAYAFHKDATTTTGDPGSARTSSANTSSVSTVITTLVPVLLYAIVYFILFLILRRKFPRNYRPRTFLGSLRSNRRTPQLPEGMFNWFGAFYATPDSYVLNHHTLDGFLFLRLLKMAVVTCLVGCVITFPVLFPVYATGDGGGSGFDVINMSNVTNNYYRYFATVGCAILFFGFILYMITRESIYFINLRQAYLLSPYYASRLSSRTVLYTSVPDYYMNETHLREMLGPSVRRVWLATDTKDLDDAVQNRDKTAMKLEGAETKLIKAANGARLKADKKAGRSSSEDTAVGDAESGNIASRYISQKDRPTHRLKPLIGKKVDTIEWCRAELQSSIPQVEEMQAKQRAGDAKMLNSVFVEFATLTDAQAAFQSLTHHHVLHMAPRFTGITPQEVIWKNLRIKWWERVIRRIATVTFVTLLVIFWSIPVAAVGAISNITTLENTTGFTWLRFLRNLPSVLQGLVTGLLPVILLAVLMALLPIILRLMAKLGGAPSLSQVELTTQNFYFAFQVVQVFLVATLGSAASSAAGTIAAHPTGITTLLANSIPKASNFYLSYFILQGLAVVSSILLGLVGLIVFMVLGKLLDKTPRKMYKRWVSLSGLGWGTLFPIYTNLFVIAICYSCIAPLVLLFAAIGLYFFYFAYRYNLLYVTNAVIDTKGAVYARALQQLFIGLYVAELCLVGLFAIGTGSSVGAVGPLILMIIFFIFTVLYHMSLNSALAPLLTYLPKSLEAEERRLLEEDMGTKETGGMDSGFTRSSTELGPAPHKKPNMITKFLKPHIYQDYATLRRLVPAQIEVRYEPEEEENAYYNPSIAAQTPLLWIPRDSMGISRQEINDTGKIIEMTDDCASLDEKNNIVWDAPEGRPPIWQKPIYY